MTASPDRANLIRPWRDALLSGTLVAMAISLGALLVYERAKSEKIVDARQHVADMAKRLGRFISDGLPASPLTEGQRLQLRQRLRDSLDFTRDHSTAARRIYLFPLSDAGSEIGYDSGLQNAPVGKTHPRPTHLERAREHFRSAEITAERADWLVRDELEATAFSVIFDRNRRPIHAVAVEADTDFLLVGLATIREALWFTCLLGVIVGTSLGAVVWRMRTCAAKVQAQLEANRKVEEAIIASLGEIVYTYETETGRFRWRGSIREVLGFEPAPEGEDRKVWLARVHPDDRARYVEALDAAAATAGDMEIEYRLQRADGTTAWMLDHVHPVSEGDGATQLAGSLVDVTARRRAEEALRLFFDETATAHLAFDGDTIVDANPAAVALFGAPDKRTLLAQPAWALWPRRQPTHALSIKGWSDEVVAALTMGSGRFEWQFLRLDGALVDCDVFLRPTTFQDREVLMVGCSDLSATKRAQAQLIASEQRFRDVSEAIGEFIWEVDAEGRYTYASSRVREVLGMEAEAVLGHTPFEFVPEEDLAEVKERSLAIFSAGVAFRNFEHRVRQPSGALLWISVSGMPSFDAGGAITGYRGASLDITKHRSYEQELMLQKEAAEAAARAKSNFLAMMSHEIRTPLNSVLGFADLLVGTPLSPTQRDYVQTIKGSGDALLTLLNDILDFSKIESGQMEVEIRATELSRCLREVLDLYGPAGREKGLTLEAAMDDDVPRHVLTDPSRLRQILLNLVGNAVKFTANGGVRVRVLRPAPEDGIGPRVRIVVADTGIGINPGQRDRLFKPFTQADSSTTRRFGGTGLGLAISKRLATLLGGELGLLDTEGAGAAFYVEIPAILPTGSQIAGHGGAPQVEFPETKLVPNFGDRVPRVLVVDDNTLNRRLTSKLLHQMGAHTDTAASAEECFDKVATGGFDLVLMDVQMPGTDGLEATRQLREREAETNGSPLPIIALTADAMVGDRERCLAAGMTDYLTKPIRRDALARALERHLAPTEG